MHGEYKVPHGKLVVVDLNVANDVLRDVRVTGDFFLYPEEALEPIVASLEGATSDQHERFYRDRIAEAIPAGTELMGFSAEAIAIAVVRAQQDAQERSNDKE